MSDVQHIVYDLKRQPYRAAKITQALYLGMSAADVDASGNQAGGDQRAGFGAVDVLKRGRIGPLAFGLQVLDRTL